jgi:hypothetical protein
VIEALKEQDSRKRLRSLRRREKIMMSFLFFCSKITVFRGLRRICINLISENQKAVTHARRMTAKLVWMTHARRQEKAREGGNDE